MSDWTWLTKAEWMLDAACQKAPDPEVFFDEDRFEEAKGFCDTCPVFGECKEFAMRERLFEDWDGVYAGMLPRHRRTEIRRINREKERLRKAIQGGGT